MPMFCSDACGDLSKRVGRVNTSCYIRYMTDETNVSELFGDHKSGRMKEVLPASEAVQWRMPSVIMCRHVGIKQFAISENI